MGSAINPVINSCIHPCVVGVRSVVASVLSGSASSTPSVSVLFATAGIFAPSNYAGRTSAAYLPDGAVVNSEELRVATDNPLSTVTRVDHVDGLDYGFNSLGIEYQLSGAGPFYYLLEDGITNEISALSYQSASGSLVEDSTNNNHGAYSSAQLFGVQTAMVIAKSVGTRYVQLRPRFIGTGVAVANFDIINGVVSQSTGTGLISTYVKMVGDYAHCYMTFTYPGGSAQLNLIDNLAAAENEGYQGDGVSGIDLTGFLHCVGEYRGTYTPSIRTDDKVITIPSILPADNPVIKYIDSNGVVITEDAKTSALCSYNGTDTITVRPDTSVSAKLVIG